MKYHSTSGSNSEKRRGFTVIEIVVSMGIFAILAGIIAPITIRMYRRFQTDAERTTLVSLLRRARSLSLSGQGGVDHGVHIASAQFTIFEGPSYAGRKAAEDVTFERSDAVSIAGPEEITFRYLSGMSASTSFTLSSPEKTALIHVNTEGTIDYE